MRRWIISAALVLVSTGVWADNWLSDFLEPADEVLWLKKAERIGIFVYDGVSDGCWTNADAVKDAIELSLRRAGIEVVDSDVTHLLAVFVVGGRTDSGCMVVREIQLEQPIPAGIVVPGASDLVGFSPLSSLSIASGPKPRNDEIRSWAIEETDALALRILRARETE